MPTLYESTVKSSLSLQENETPSTLSFFLRQNGSEKKSKGKERQVRVALDHTNKNYKQNRHAGEI